MNINCEHCMVENYDATPGQECFACGAMLSPTVWQVVKARWRAVVQWWRAPWWYKRAKLLGRGR